MNLVKSWDNKFESVYERNVDSVYKISYMYVKNKSDAEDLVQNTFMKYLKSNPEFSNLSHEKAWFIVTTSNTAKNHFKTWWNRNAVITYEHEKGVVDSTNETLEYVLNLPNKYKEIVYMFYYEGYTTKEISSMINKNESTIRTDLSKARNLLKQKMGSGL